MRVRVHLCAHNSCTTAISNRGALGFERGQSSLEGGGGHSTTVCRFGKNLGSLLVCTAHVPKSLSDMLRLRSLIMLPYCRDKNAMGWTHSIHYNLAILFCEVCL